MRYVDSCSSFNWLTNAKFQIAKATKWAITPAHLEEHDMAYLLDMLEFLDIDSFIEERWTKEHERQAKLKDKRF